MARLNEIGTDEIYTVAEQFRDNCLLQNGSLLFTDLHLWQAEILKELHKSYVENPDEGDRSFIDKFKDQLSNTSNEAKCLAGEILCIYFLFPSSVGGDLKRKTVDKVLGWANKTLPNESHIPATFDHGIGSGGYGYNTNRYLEIAFLIEFAIEWKKLSKDQQQEKASDPWLFQKFVDEIEGAESRQLRHMLLHLLFPATFERIASGNHKRQIVNAFSGLIGDTLNSEDEQILAIREELQNLLPDESLDFYRPPLDSAWSDAGQGERTSEISLEMISHKKQIVLYGPPGTGKTFRAKRLAESIIRSAILKTRGAPEYFRTQGYIEKKIKYNVHHLQLHPSYGYEDFIRGLHIANNGATEYRLGYLPRLIEDMEKEIKKQPNMAEDPPPHVLILDEMNRTDLSRMLGECFSLLENRGDPVPLPGCNKDGTTYELKIPENLYVIGTMNLIDQSIEQIDFALRRRFLWELCPFNADAFLAVAEHKWNVLNSELTWDRIADDFKKLAEAAKSLNNEIRDSTLLGPQYEIGHTYLFDVIALLRNFLGIKPTRKRLYLWNGKGEALLPVIQIWNLSLHPLLEQYLAGLDEASRKDELKKLEKVFLKPIVD